MTARWDVLGLGCTTVDDLLYVETFPTPDQKTRVRRSERQCGGLTGTALVAAARLGARCAYGGLLGDDELSRTVEANFRRHGIDTTPAVRRGDARPIHSTIVVAADGHTRNIFFEVSGPTGADDSLPPADVLCAARVLLVDHYGVEGNLRAVGVARGAGIPVVADLERDEAPRFAELLAAVDHLVLSERFALRVTGAPSPMSALARLRAPGRAAAVVTCGERGCWYEGREPAGARRPGQEAEPGTDPPAGHQRAFPVEVADTTGCGDVFHGAYAAALAWGWPLPRRVEFASAAAALKATCAGGQKGAPDRAAVEAFLAAHA